MPTISFEPQTRQANGKPYAFVPLSGTLDESNLIDISEKIDPLVRSDHAYLVIDLGAVDLVSSHAVTYLEKLYRELSAVEKQLAFIRASSELREILEFVGLAKLIATFDAEEKFIEAIARKEI